MPAKHLRPAYSFARLLSLVLYFCPLLASASFVREAESFVEPSPYTATTANRWQRIPDPSASGGFHIAWPQASFDRSTDDTGAPAADDPQALFNFTTTSTQNIGVWIRTIAPTQGDDSIYYSLNRAAWTRFNGVKTAAWTWLKLAQFNNLPAGSHSLSLRPREDGFQVDTLYFSTDGSPPPRLLGNLLIEAEDADSSLARAPWSQLSGSGSTGAGYLTWSGSGQARALPASGDQGQLHYHTFVEEPATVDVWVRVRFPSTADDRLYFRWNNDAWSTQESWLTPNWSWRKIATRTVTAPGLQTLKLAAGEDGVSIDAVYFATDGSWPGPGAYYHREAEDFTNTSGLAPLEKRLDDVDASVGAYLAWHQTGADATNSDPAASGRATYDIPHGFTGEDLTLSARLKLPTTNDNSFFYRLQGVDSAWQTFEATPADPGVWQWFTLRSYPALPAGDYTLEIVRRENGARIDQFHLSADGSAPRDTVGRRPADALTAYYVSPHGDDANPGTADRPWRTPRHAAAQLPPGATAYIRGGLYPITAGIVIANTGSESSPLRFAGYPGERPIFDGTNLDYANYSQVVLVKSKSWVVLENLHVVNSPQQGIILVASSHSTIQHCSTTRTGMSGIAAWGDFGTQSPCRHIRILHNRVFEANIAALDPTLPINPATGVPDKANHEAITIGRAEHFEVAYNEVAYGQKEGIDSKGPNRFGRIHHNIVHHHQNSPYTAGIYLDAWSAAQHDIEVHDNIIYNCGKGVSVDSEDGQPIYNIRIYRNLAYNNSDWGFTVGHSSSNAGAAQADFTREVHFFNNTAVGNGVGLVVNNNLKNGAPIVTDISLRNNLFVNNRGREIHIPGSVTSQRITLAYNQAWDADVTGSTNINADFGPREPNDLWADPLFVSPSTLDYRLSPTSPARNSGDPAPAYLDPDGTRADRGALPFTANLPIAASSPAPAHTSSGSSLSPTLSWTSHVLARSHRLFFGTTPDLGPAQLLAELPAATTRHLPGTLRPGVTYYWRVDTLGLAGTTPGPVWSFTTGSTGLPGTAVRPSPAPGATGVATGTDRLSWAPVPEADDYLVHFGTTPTLTAAQLRSIQSGLAFDPGTLAPSTTYHWRVDTRNNSGITPGPLWTFTTAGPGAPAAASAPAPANASTAVWRHPLLRWSPAPGATSYDVYLGTSPTLGTAQLLGNTPRTDRNLPLLAANTTYHWRVDARNTNGVTPGPLWSFTTGSSSFSDDFNDGNFAGWSVVSGSWSVSSGRLRQTGNVANDLIYLNNPSALAWTDTITYATFNSTDDDIISLVFRYQNPDNYYRLSLSADPGDRFTRLEKRVAGVSSIIVGNTSGYTPSTTFQVEIWAVGDQITVYLDGINPFGISVQDPDLTSGSIGFHANFNNNGFFDDVHVLTLSQAPSAPRSLLASTGSRLGEIDLAWVHEDDLESGFRLERRVAGTDTWTLVQAALPANSRLFTDRGLLDATSYQYRLRAFNSRAPSAWLESPATNTRAAAGLFAPLINSQPLDATRALGQSHTFTVSATANPAPTFQWRKNGLDLPGATSPSLSLPSLVAGDAATYRVLVRNSLGEVLSSPATLTLLSPPQLAPLPATLTLDAGATLELTVTVSSGTAPFTYQWRKDGADLPGATSATLSRPALTPDDAGEYRVLVTNAAASTLSSPLALSIRSGPPPPTPVLIENTDPTRVAYTGPWFEVALTGSSSGSIHSLAQTATGRATITPGLSGTYRLELFQPAWSRSSPAVNLTLNHAAGSTPLTIDQAAQAGTWTRLGSTDFVLGPASTLVLEGQVGQDPDTTEERPILDALRLTPITGPGTPRVGAYFEAEDFDP
jgi:hypothetical protein